MEKEEREQAAVNAGLAGGNAETVHRYGSAVKEHIVAYTGTDNETGKQLKRSLQGISESATNQDYAQQNIKQQAGFSAEVETVARENAEKAVQGNDASQVIRTDDMANQSAGKNLSIGGTNDQLYDIAEIDSNGSYIEGTARQLKYVGGDAKECCKKLLTSKYDKYRDADAQIEIPADYYDDVKSELREQAKSLERQIKNAEARGETDLAEKRRAQLDRVTKTDKNLRQGKLTNAEAIEARLHPKLFTAKEIARLSHRAGMESAQYSAMVGGGISFIQNSIAVVKGDKTVGEAVVEVAGDSAKAAGLGYATGFLGSTIKGQLQNSSSEYLRVIADKTNLPGTVAVAVLETGKTLVKYFSGEIDGTECLTELGEKGTGMVASTMGASVGQVLIPVPIVGGLIGGMVGYAMSSAYYNSLVTALNEAKVAHEERLRIEAECQVAVKAIREYRFEMELAIRNYFQENITIFTNAFAVMDEAYQIGDAKSFIEGANMITRQLGQKPLFDNSAELDKLMENPAPIKL